MLHLHEVTSIKCLNLWIFDITATMAAKTLQRRRQVIIYVVYQIQGEEFI